MNRRPEPQGISSGKKRLCHGQLHLVSARATKEDRPLPRTDLIRSPLALAPALRRHVADVNVDDSIEGPKLSAEDALGELLGVRGSYRQRAGGLQQRELPRWSDLGGVSFRQNFPRCRIEAEIDCNQRARQ